MEAPPESGFVRTKGNIAAGIFKKSHTGSSIFTKKSEIPDAEKILIDTVKAHMVGNKERELLMPSLAPFINEEK